MSGTNEREPLSAALDAIADGAARAHEGRERSTGGLDLVVVRAAARRRRTRFGAGVGLAAAGVVGALLLGGAALARVDAPVPPAATEQAPVPLVCGTRLADLPAPDGGPDAQVMLDLASTEVALGHPLEGTVTVRADESVDRQARNPLELALVRDGVVVGLSDIRFTSAEVLDVAPQLLACDPSSTGSVLPAGEYSVVAVVLGLWLNSGEPWPYVLVSRPVAVDVADADPNAASNLPACGEPTAGLAPTAGAVTATPAVRVGTLDATGGFVHDGRGDALAVMVGLGNDGPDLSGALGVQLEMAVAQDGVVVASWGGDHTDPAPADWPALGWRTAEWSGQVARCGADAGRGLGPGRYTLWVRATTRAADGPGGEPEPIVVVAPPVEFTVRTAEDSTDPDLFMPDTDADWPFVDPSEVPGALPFTLDPADEVTAAQAGPDGRRWRVSVAHAGGRDTYRRLLDEAVAAGFDVVREETDPERPFWSYAQLRRDGLLVALDVSNETGGGFYATWLVVSTG